MSKFIIKIEDPGPLKDQIIRFWDEYLPGTPSKRFEWMNHGNPAGNTIWFFAFEETNHELNGTVSIMAKELIRKGNKIRVGIVGDFMVSSKHRVFGPTFQLMKKVVSSYRELGFSALYTIPNQESMKIIMRSGFEIRRELTSYVKPLDYVYYLSKKIPSFYAGLLSPFVSFGMKIISLETYMPLKGYFDENDEINESFDLFFDHLKKDHTSAISDHSSSYLIWRFKNNPQYKFRFLSYRKDRGKELSGYAVYTITEDNRLIIYELIGLEKKIEYMILKRLIKLASRERYRSVQISISENSMITRMIKKFGFFDAKEKTQVLMIGGEDIPFRNWNFVSGDRNI